MLDRLVEALRKTFKSRFIPIVTIYILLFFVLIIRLFALQIVESDELVDKSIATDEKVRDIKSSRGNIYDCNGNILASNQLSYSVTIEDTGELTTNAAKNEAILKMIQIIKKNNDELNIDFYIELNKDNELIFTVDKSGELRFKRDAYFAKSIDDLTDEQKNATAKEVFEYLRTDISSSGPRFDISEDYSVEEALLIMSVRYTMMINSYTKYLPITIANKVSNKTVIAIKENSSEMSGVKIAEDTTRLYYDSKYFSNILGYTGRIASDDLENIKELYPEYNYTIADQIGKTGIELSMEDTLRGTKGSETLVIDNNSRITEVKNVINPEAGNDLYLTINSDIQKACYTILEKKLAGILISKINNNTNAGTKGESASDIRIPIYDVYNALIENNIIDTTHFTSKKASETEQKIYSKFKSEKKNTLNQLKQYIKPNYKTPNNKLNDANESYLNYIYSMLTEKGVISKENIDTSDETYKKYTNGQISLSEFLEFCIVNNWINFKFLDISEEFNTTSELFEQLKDYIFKVIDNDNSFNKLIYKQMIYNYTLSGTDICLLLIDQGIVKATSETISKLKGGLQSPYSFIIAKITSLELTPAMLALEPCSGSVVMTDVNTGKVIAYVSYPTYDNNKFANEINSEYYNKLMSSLAFPLMNRPSMQKTAPGSTFKMITSAAALEEQGILSNSLEKIRDKHEFTEIIPSPKCWSKSSHGNIDVTDALRYSCNYFFYEVGYRLGLTSNNILNHNKGLDLLKKYAEMFGLGQSSGLELSEALPAISDYDCVRSAIGQGTNSFTPAQLARYVSTIANSGKCYELTLVDKIANIADNNIYKNKPNLSNTINFSSSTWNYIHEGMRKVVTGGSVESLFEGVEIEVAGKTGTAQENDYKPNHALFVSYAPYDDPEISLTVVIPNGYTSGNAAELARDIYKYYYNIDEREDILNSNVTKPENQSNAFSD